MIVLNPIMEIINEGWDDNLQKINQSSLHSYARTMLPNLDKIINNLLLENDTNYAYEELFNFGYIGLIYAMLEDENLNYDRGLILENTTTFLTKLIEAEQLEETIHLNSCEQKDCCGKECSLKMCNLFLPVEDNQKEQEIIEKFMAENNLEFINPETTDDKTLVLNRNKKK